MPCLAMGRTVLTGRSLSWHSGSIHSGLSQDQKISWDGRIGGHFKVWVLKSSIFLEPDPGDSETATNPALFKERNVGGSRFLREGPVCPHSHIPS